VLELLRHDASPSSCRGSCANRRQNCARLGRHPNRLVVERERDFMRKADHALELINAQIPRCCASRDLLGAMD
jgi:hypothetical protein